MGSSWFLLACIMLAVVVTSAVAASLADFAGSAAPAAASQQLAHSPGASLQISGQISADTAKTDTAAIPAVLRRAFGAREVRLTAAVWSDPLGMPAALPSRFTVIAEVAAADGIAAHIRVLAGTWPGPPRNGQPIPVAVPQSVARAFGIGVGRVLAVKDNDTGAPIRLLVVAVFAERDPADRYWGLNLIGASGLNVAGDFRTYGPFIADRAAFAPGRLATGEASWLVIPEARALRPAGLIPLAARILTAESYLRQTPAFGGLTVTTSMPQLLLGVASTYALARSLLAVSLLQLLLVAAAAVMLAARLLVTRRAPESALMTARGAGRSQLIRLTTAEAVLLSGAAAVTGGLVGVRLAGPLARSGPLRAADLRISAGSAAVWWAAGALLVLVTAIMIWPAMRPAGSEADQARRGRQQALAGATRAGADVAVLLLALLAAWQLRTYSVVSHTTSGALRIDPILIAAPTLVLAGGGLILLRLVPAAAKAAQWAAARGRHLNAALACWEIGRRPVRNSGPALLATLAVATATLALAQQQSWRASAADQAAFAAGADIRVDLASPVPVGAVATITHARGVITAMPVSALNGGVLAIGARQAPATVLLRPDQSTLPAGILFRLLRQNRRASGLMLPGRPARLALDISLTQEPGGPALGPLQLSVTVRDGTGALYPVAAGQVRADGRAHLMVAPLSSSRHTDYPLSLASVTWTYQLPPWPEPAGYSQRDLAAAARAAAAAAQRQVVAQVRDVSVSDAGYGPFDVPFATGAALSRWSAGARSAGMPTTPNNFETAPSVQAESSVSGAADLAFRPGVGSYIPNTGTGPIPVGAQEVALFGTAGWTAGPQPHLVTGIATDSFLVTSHAKVGDTVSITAGNAVVPVRVLAAIRSFPTVTSPEGALIVDLPTVQGYLVGQQFPPLPVTSWWLRTDSASVPPGLPGGSAITDRAAIASGITGDALATAPELADLAVAAAVCLLAILGFAVSVAASVAERRSRNALLAALGVSKLAQAGQLCLEQLLLSGPGAIAGLLLGYGIAYLLIPAVTLTNTGNRPMPPVVVYLPASWAIGLAAFVTAVPVLAAAATLAMRRDPAAQLLRAAAG